MLPEKIHLRCDSILANLWHAPSTEEAIGTAATGSSEAAQLGGLAMKKMWQRKNARKNIHEPASICFATHSRPDNSIQTYHCYGCKCSSSVWRNLHAILMLNAALFMCPWTADTD